MAEKLENTILFDWFSFTTNLYDFSTIIPLLGLESITNWEERPGRNYYKFRRWYDGITIEWENTSNADSLHVEFSGQGCRAFETYSSLPDFNRLLKYVVDGDFNLTRIDIAFDDFSGLLNIDKLIKEASLGHFISEFRSFLHTHEFKNVRPVPIDKGHSIGFGSVKSDVYFRCYDKRLEREREDLEHWVRFEMQIRNSKAVEFSKNYFLLDKNIGETFSGVLNKYIRFCKPSSDTNISRWKTASWWSKFAGNANKISLYSPKTTSYNLLGVQEYVIGQAGNSIDVLLKTIGKDAFFELLDNRKSELSTKQLNLIDEYDLERFRQGEGIEF